MECIQLRMCILECEGVKPALHDTTILKLLAQKKETALEAQPLANRRACLTMAAVLYPLNFKISSKDAFASLPKQGSTVASFQVGPCNLLELQLISCPGENGSLGRWALGNYIL